MLRILFLVFFFDRTIDIVNGLANIPPNFLRAPPISSNPIREVAIIGSGPAGYTAAIYTSRALLNPLVIGGYSSGGQLTLTSEVENFPGYPIGVAGPRLMDDLKTQAERFGSEIWNVDCESVDFNCYPYLIHLPNATVAAKSIIIATGAESLWLKAKSEDNFKGLGISTCATCDGAFFKNEDVVVVGGGDSAMEEATFLTKFAKSVTILNRSSKLRASKVMQERVRSNSKIRLLTNRIVNRWLGKERTLEGVEVTNTCDQTVSNIPCSGAFIAIGHRPNTNFLTKGEGKKVALDSEGYIQTHTNTATHTNLPGVFACGDVTDKKYRQAITAAGSGCQAAMDAEEWLQHQ